MIPQHDRQNRKMSPELWVGVIVFLYLIPLIVLLLEGSVFGSFPIARLLGSQGLSIVRIVYYPILRLIY
jgi:hypothetical protein